MSLLSTKLLILAITFFIVAVILYISYICTGAKIISLITIGSIFFVFSFLILVYNKQYIYDPMIEKQKIVSEISYEDMLERQINRDKYRYKSIIYKEIYIKPLNNVRLHRNKKS